MRRYRKTKRRSVKAGGGETGRGTAEMRPAEHDEPALAGLGENPETDMSPTVLGHQVAGRPESLETDTAPPAIDHALPGAPATDPSVCAESGEEGVTAEDLH